MSDEKICRESAGSGDGIENREDEDIKSEATASPEEYMVVEEEMTEGETIKKLRGKLKECEKEQQEYLEGWQRAKADFINARKEEERSREAFAKFASAEVLQSFMPVLDSFELAFENKEAWEKVSKEWRVGVEYIYSQLKTILAENGFTELNPENEQFDPHSHIGAGTVSVENKEDDGKVMQVLQRGYVLHGKLIRGARVSVGEYKEEK